MKGYDGADEQTFKALKVGIRPQDVLTLGLMPGMEKVNWINSLSQDQKQKLIEKHKNCSKNRV